MKTKCAFLSILAIAMLLLSAVVIAEGEESSDSSGGSSDSSGSSESSESSESPQSQPVDQSAEQSTAASGESSGSESSGEDSGPSFEEQKAEALRKVEQMKQEITESCQEDPRECSCDIIPCEDILEAEHEDKDKAYDKCTEEKAKCEEQRQKGIAEYDKQKSEMESVCKENLEKCDCSKISSEAGRRECQMQVKLAEEQISQAKAEMANRCSSDLANCDCSAIKDLRGRKSCFDAVQDAKKNKERCESQGVDCDCSTFNTAEGRQVCEQKKTEAISKVAPDIKNKITKCLGDLEHCDCSYIPREEWKNFCETQRDYGLSCLNNLQECDKLSDGDLLPSSLPGFLKDFLRTSIKKKYEDESKKASEGAVKAIKTCITSPNECDCVNVPDSVKDFCFTRKDLAIACYDKNDYDSCLKLDTLPTLPPMLEKYDKSKLSTRIAEQFKEVQKGIVMEIAARQIGKGIINCMDSPAACDCSYAPQGIFKAFCEEKKSLTQKCILEKDFDSCMRLDTEPLMIDTAPLKIKDYIERNIKPIVEVKKQKIYEEMRPAECSGLNLKECWALYLRCKGKTVAECSTQPLMIEFENEDTSYVQSTCYWCSREHPAKIVTRAKEAFGDNYWYLSYGGDSLLYNVEVPAAGKYKFWIRDFIDNYQPAGVRYVDIYVGHKKAFSEVKEQSFKMNRFAWHYVGDVELVKGINDFKFIKPATTSGAALLDAFYLTTGSETPKEK